MLDSLSNKGININRILHLWESAKVEDGLNRQAAFQTHIEKGYYSLIFLSQAIAAQKIFEIAVCLLSLAEFSQLQGMRRYVQRKAQCLDRLKSFHRNIITLNAGISMWRMCRML